MKRFKIQAVFMVQAEDAAEAKDIAQDMCNDMVSEQYEDVESVIVVGEVEQDDFHHEEEET